MILMGMQVERNCEKLKKPLCGKLKLMALLQRGFLCPCDHSHLDIFPESAVRSQKKLLKIS